MGYVSNQIIDFVKEYLNNNKDLLKYDKTLMAKVVSVDNSTAIVESSEHQFTCRIKDGIDFSVGDIVVVKIPNNNNDHKYIDGKLKK